MKLKYDELYYKFKISSYYNSYSINPAYKINNNVINKDDFIYTFENECLSNIIYTQMISDIDGGFKTYYSNKHKSMSKNNVDRNISLFKEYIYKLIGENVDFSIYKVQSKYGIKKSRAQQILSDCMFLYKVFLYKEYELENEI